MILFTSDWHIDAGNFLRDKEPDSRWALQQLLFVLEETNPSLVVVAGDTLDQRKPHSKVIHMMQEFAEQTRPWEFAYIQGQHEMSSPPWLDLFGWEHMHLKVIERDGVRIAGMDYTEPDILFDAPASIPECDILVLHQTWLEFTGVHLMPSLDEFIESLSFRPALVATGDYHCTKSLITDSGNELLSIGYLYDNPVHPIEFPQVCLYEDGRVESVMLHRRPMYVFSIPEENEETVIKNVQEAMEAYRWQILGKDLIIPDALRAPFVILLSDSDHVQDAYAISNRLRSMGVTTRVRRRAAEKEFSISGESGVSLPSLSLEQIVEQRVSGKLKDDIMGFLRAPDVVEHSKVWWKERTGKELEL